MLRNALFLCLALAPVASAATKPEIPAILYSNWDGKPLWVSAATAIDENGDLRTEFFSDVDVQIMERGRSQNVGGCRTFRGSPEFEKREPPTLDALVAGSYTIVSGKVTGAEPGFASSMPGTLFRIEISARLKSFGHDVAGPAVYLFVPRAQIETPKGWFCSEQIFRNVEVAVGQQIVVFDELPGIDRDRQILESRGRGRVVILNNEGPRGLSWLPQDTDNASFIAEIARNAKVHVVPERPRR